MPLIVEQNVLVALHDPHLRIVQMIGNPGGVNQRLRVSITTHQNLPHVILK